MSYAFAEDQRYGCSQCHAVFRTGFARCPTDGTPLQRLDEDPLVGKTFADRYVIEACVGEGGMGRVYRARHIRVSRRFAVKVLFGELATDPKMRERFAREAETASRLDHRNVVSVVDFGETDEGLLYLVMDFVEGPTLAEILLSGPLEPARARRLCRELALGLGHAHDLELVHRDFKPENVIVSGEGDTETPRIVDFGIAMTLEMLETSRLTTQGMIMGTPAYMAPEQATDERVDHRCDLFALGAILYEMLAGVLPFDGTQQEIAAQNLAAPVPPIAMRSSGIVVDGALEEIARRLLAKRPENRYASALEVIADLDGGEVRPRELTPRPRVAETSHVTDEARPAKARRGWIAAAVGLAVLALAGVLGLGLTSGDDDAPPRDDRVVEPATPAGEPASSPPSAGPELAAAAEASAVDLEAIPEPAPAVQASRPATRPHARRRPDRVQTRRRSDPAQPTSEAATRATTEAAPAVESTPIQPSSQQVQKLYVDVGESLQRLGNETGHGSIRDLKQRYARIPIADALRKPAMRAETVRSLESLRRELSRRAAPR